MADPRAVYTYSISAPDHAGALIDPGMDGTPFDRYRDEPRFQSNLDRSVVIGYKTCCPFSPEPSPGR